VPNSLPGREDITLKIFGMAGVPLEGIAERNGEGELAECHCALQSAEIARTLEKCPLVGTVTSHHSTDVKGAAVVPQDAFPFYTRT
jgi:hypothetical protein